MTNFELNPVFSNPGFLWQLSFLIAAIAIILFVSSEILVAYSDKVSFLVDKRRMRIAGIVATLAFLVTVAVNYSP